MTAQAGGLRGVVVGESEHFCIPRTRRGIPQTQRPTVELSAFGSLWRRGDCRLDHQGLSINFPTISYAQDTDDDATILNVADDPPIADAVLPVTA